MQTYPNGAILDEVQRTPHLLSYIQVRVDEMDRKGMFIRRSTKKTYQSPMPIAAIFKLI